MKQRSLTTRKYGVFLAFLLVLSMVFGAFARVNVYADDSNTSGVSKAYDEKAKGSITVELQDIQSQETTNKNGVELTLYKVADIRTDHNYIEFALVDELKDLESLTGTDINDITTGEANREAGGRCPGDRIYGGRDSVYGDCERCGRCGSFPGKGRYRS